MSITNEIVVGIDVGTTSAICILDKNLNILFLKSKKEYKTSEIIDDIIKFGKPLLISCDVAKIPKKVLKIAKSLGIKVFHPKEDVKEEKKMKLTKKYFYKNWHERDAIFSAIIAAKFLRKKKLERIDNSNKIKEKKNSNNLKKTIEKTDYKEIIKKLIHKIRKLKEENRKIKEQIERIKKISKENVKIKYVEVKNEDLEIENKALKTVIKILKMKMEKNEIPYIKLNEINEQFLKILKEHIKDIVLISNEVEKFYIIEKLGFEYVITSKNVENVWNFKLIFDEIEKYEEIGKINIEVLKSKWKERIFKILNEGNI
ncbi:MAG: DUF460 domain-containing protein [Candidatus Aenigmatarchaeota archaeon]